MLQQCEKYRTALPGTVVKVKGSKREKRVESSHNEGGAGRALRRNTPSELPTSLSVLHSFQTLHSTSREVSVQTYT